MPRPLLIFISDIHLTDALRGASISRVEAFKRFWIRIDAARADRAAELCFVGDLFDIVRSPKWLDGEHRPFHEPTAPMLEVVDRIVDGVLEREALFFGAIHQKVKEGALKVHYILGNHDRLLRFSPGARRKIWKALTGEDKDVEFPQELVFPDHHVLAFHGHRNDFICFEEDGSAPIGDGIGAELIVKFPKQVRDALSEPLPELDDIDDVRPIYTVPAWVRHFAARRKGILKPVGKVWKDVVESFLENAFTKDWMSHHRKGFFDERRKLQMLLQLSTGKIMRKTSDHRLAQLYRFFQQGFDGHFAKSAAQALSTKEYEGLRYVVNGHSHFASMIPLGQIEGQSACYFNTGTWRTVHQMGHLLDGRPAFIPYDAMSYLVFFPEDDPMGRDYEWWNGALVPRDQHAAHA